MMELVKLYWIYALGFFAQALFGTRLLVQLFHSERQGKVVSPTIFWQISLLASFLFLIYGIIRNDVVIILGQTLSYFVYIRNLQLKNDWSKIPLSLRIILFLLPIVTFGWLIFSSASKLTQIFSTNDLTNPIIILGAIGQLLLNFRFVYQWYYSEKHKTSILPLGFWIISTVASVMILRYSLNLEGGSISVREPVLLVAQGMGIFVYVRNIFIHFKAKSKALTQ